MSSSLVRTALRSSGLITAGALAATALPAPPATINTIAQILRDGLVHAKAALLAPLGADANANAALAASLRDATLQLERALRAHSSHGGVARPLLLLAAPFLTAGYLVYHYGWDRVGWVSAERFRAGLASLRTLVERRLLGVEVAIEAVKSAVDEVKTEVLEVKDAVTSIERSMHRTSTGVDILCDLVANSSLVHDAIGNERAIARLRSYGDDAPRLLLRPPTEAAPGEEPPDAPRPEAPASRQLPSYVQAALQPARG